MSGIFGILNPALQADALTTAKRMGDQMRHHEYYTVEATSPDPGVAVGRIGIGIFNRAPQPHRSADGQVWLWYTGEFYHEARRRSELEREALLRRDADDAEFALATYLKEGTDGLTRLHGAFVVAIWDERAGELSIVNDRFGLYPHYYARLPGGFAFAPEIKALVGLSTVSRELDWEALAEYVRFQQILGEKTWFAGVKLLPPASVLRFRPADDHLDLSAYWDWTALQLQPSISFDEAVSETSRLFQRAIDAMTVPPHRLGVYLSGGLDGRAILGYVRRNRPLATITYGAADSRDVIYAEKLARRAGRLHQWFPLQNGQWVLQHAAKHLALTEGLHSWMHGHGMSTLTGARQILDVNLSGWDGGTTLGGYLDDYDLDRTYRHAPTETDLTQRLYDAFCQRMTWPGLTEAEEATVFGDEHQHLRGVAFDSFQTELARTSHYPMDRRSDWFYLRQRVLRSTVNMITFTRSAIEVRCPFFDYDFLSFLYSLPEQIRATPELQRAVITRRAPSLALIPNDRDERLPHAHPLVREPHAFAQRVKGFVNRRVAPIFPSRPRLYADYEQYLRTDLRMWAERILFDRRTLDRGLFDETAVRALWNRHQSGRELWTIGKIAPLITIELVLRNLHDGDDTSTWRTPRALAAANGGR